MPTVTDTNLPWRAHRGGTRAFRLVSLAFLVACGDPAGEEGPGSGGSSNGGTQSAGGSVNGGSGGSVASGGSIAGSSGSPGPSGGGMAGQSAGGPSGGMGPSVGGQPGGGAGVGGQAQPGGGTAGRGGASGAGQGGAAGGGGGSPPSGCKGGKVVHFVYFVEADQTYSESQRADVEKQAFAFQRYWFEQLGATFHLNEPVVDVIRADHPASWYLTNPDGIHGDERWYRLGNVKNEVYRKLEISNFDANHRVVNYPTTRHDGRVGGNFGGAWMDGDDLTCIATNGVNYPYDDRNSAHCLGHVAHEFGHVLGLDHEGPQTDCMLYGFYAPPGGAMCTFSPANVAKIKADPDNAGWLNAMPGQTCTAD